jgi:hypothetical protein
VGERGRGQYAHMNNKTIKKKKKKGTKNILWKTDSLFNKCCWEKWLSACRKQKLDPWLSPCTRVILFILEAIGIGNDFFKGTPAAQQLRERMDKWDNMKLKNFCPTK